MLCIDDIETLFLTKGHAQYSGEPVTQLQHVVVLKVVHNLLDDVAVGNLAERAERVREIHRRH